MLSDTRGQGVSLLLRYSVYGGPPGPPPEGTPQAIPGAGDAPLPFVDPGASPDGTPQEVPLGIPTPVAVDDSAELAASRARVETLRREVYEQRRRADDALSRVATSERAIHVERGRANTAEAARVEGGAALTDADRRHRTELSTADRRREEAEPRLSEMLGLPDDRQWHCLLGCATWPASAARKLVASPWVIALWLETMGGNF